MPACYLLHVSQGFPRACVEKSAIVFRHLSDFAALPAGRIVIATTAVTVTVGKKTAIAGGKETTFVCLHKPCLFFSTGPRCCFSLNLTFLSQGAIFLS